MCFFEQHIYECGDSRLGKFRQHCERETRVGKTCGTKSILETIYIERKCAICSQIDEKLLQRSKDVETIEKLMAEGGKDKPALDAAIDSIQFLDFDIKNLKRELEEKRQSTNDDLPPYTPPSPRINVSRFQGLNQSQQPLLPGIDLNQVSPATLALLASSLLHTERVIYQRQDLLFTNSNPGSASHSPLRGQPSTANQPERPFQNNPSTHSPAISRNSSVYGSRSNSPYISRANSPFISRPSTPIPLSANAPTQPEVQPSHATSEPRPDAPLFMSLVRAPTYKADDPKGKAPENSKETKAAEGTSSTSLNNKMSNESTRESSEFLSIDSGNSALSEHINCAAEKTNK